MNNTASTLKPVSRTTLSEQVAMQLAAELEAKRWNPGEKLPSEADLCKVFNVGRSTLREALKSLSFIGMIRMRAGGGSYVAEQRSKYLDGSRLLAKSVLTTDKIVDDFCEVRLLIEAEIAGLCAQRATEEDLRKLEGIVHEMKTLIDQDGKGFSDLDLRFHMAIAAKRSRRSAHRMFQCRHHGGLLGVNGKAQARSTQGAHFGAHSLAIIPTWLQSSLPSSQRELAF